ncbi:unnamed protein product, partial [Closterium sp. NIES-53]
MASLRVLAFNHEGRPVQFDTWLDDLQLYILSDSKDSVSQFDLASGVATAPPATADSATRSQWLTRDAAARLAICNHLPLAECAHFGQQRTTQALYDAVVARYSSPATAALGRLLLPYLFPQLSAYASVEDLVSHLCASDTRYRAAAPAEFLDKNQPFMFITLYFIVTRLSDSLRSVRDHFLSLDPTSLTVDLLEQHLLTAETSAVAVGAACGTLRSPFFEGCSPSPFAPSYASAAAADISVAEDVGAASASAKRRSSKGKGGRGGGGGSGGGGGGSGSSGGGSNGGGGGGGTGGNGGGGTGGSGSGAWRGCSGAGKRQQQQRRSETQSPQQLRASRCFFRDITTLTPLPAPVSVRLADPSRGPVVARSSTVLPCPALPSGSLLGFHLPSFSTNLVSTAALQDAIFTTTTPRGQGSSLYTLATEPPQVAAFAQVSASGQIPPPCSCRHLSHQTLMWNHCLGHPSLPRLRGMHSRLLVSGLPRSLPPLPPSPAPPCLPCIEGRQRATPHSSSFFPTTAPLQTLHMDVEGILQSFMLPDSPQQNGIAERRIGLVMEVARTSMIHAAAPHFLWPFAVQYAAHQLNLWPRASLPETLPTLRWTGKVGDASVLRVWGSYAFVRDLYVDKLSTRAIPCVFLGFFPNAPGSQFYHPTSRRLLPSQDVTFDESVPFYRLFPYRSAPLPPPPLFLAPGPPSIDPLPPQGPAPSCVSPAWGAELDGAGPKGSETGGAETGGAEPGGVENGGVVPGGPEPGCAASEDAESGGTEPQGAASSGGSAGASPRLSPQQLREWFVWHARLRSGATGAGGAGVAGAGGAGVTAGAGVPGGTAVTGPGGARTRGIRAGGTGGVGGAGAGDPTESGAAGAGGSGASGARAGGAGSGGTGAGGAGAGGAAVVDPGGALRLRPYFVPLLQQVLGTPFSLGLTPPLLCPPPDQSQPPLPPASPLRAPSPYTKKSDGLIEQREPTSRLVSHVRTAPHVPRSRPPPVPGTHAMTLRPFSVPPRVPLPVPPESSLPKVPDPESDRARAGSPTISRFLASAVTDPSFESAAASAFVAELLDFAATCHLDYASALVAESASSSPPSVGGDCALSTDVLKDWNEDFECLSAAVPRFASMLLAPEGDPDAPDIWTPCSYAEVITGPFSSQWQAALDAEMASWKSTGTYIDEVPPSRANIVDGMWIFRVKRPPGSRLAFKARYVARGFSQRMGVDYFRTFSPTSKMTTFWMLLQVAAQRDYELQSLDFSTAFLQGSLHEEIWLRRPPGFTGSFPAGTPWSLRRPVYSLRQTPREWLDTLRTTLAALGFAPSIADPSLFLRADTSLPPFYVLVYVDDLVFATDDTEALILVKSELQMRHTCTDLGELRSYLGLQITQDSARRSITLTQSHKVNQVLQRFGFQFSSPQPTPLSTSHSLSALPSVESIEPSGPYPELVGCLIYLMMCTRPDLAYPLSLLARYVAPRRHRKVHWDAAKRVLRYLCSTSAMGLVLGGRGPVVRTGHADASWVDDSATQRASQGYTFSLGSISVSWRSTRSSSVLSSSCEAEFYARAMAAHEVHWLTYLLTDLGEQPRSPLHLGQLRLAYMATRANTADIFTKALLPACFALLDWSCDHLLSPTLPMG